MSTDLVPLAFLMFAVTYPSRAIGLLNPAIDRLPRRALEYLQLVGPAVLAALAAVPRHGRRPCRTIRFVVGLPWVSVVACIGLVAWRRNLFLGLVAAVAIAIAGRAAGLELTPATDGAGDLRPARPVVELRTPSRRRPPPIRRRRRATGPRAAGRAGGDVRAAGSRTSSATLDDTASARSR